MSDKTSNKAPAKSSGAAAPAESAKEGYWQGAVKTINAFNPLASKASSEGSKEKKNTNTNPEHPAEESTLLEKDEKQSNRFPVVRAGGAAVGAAGSAVMSTVKGAAYCVHMINPMAYDSESDDSVSEDDRDPLHHPEKQEVLRKKESALAVMLRNAKNKYVQKGLEGKVTIQILVGVVTSGEYCTISKNDTVEKVEEGELKQLGALNFKAVSAMDAIIANLSRRSKQYAGKELRSGVTLTQGVSFGIGVPFLISVGFQTSIQFECTVDSLVRYQKRKERLKAFQKKLKSIKNADDLISDVMSGGFSMETATRAVVATDGVGEEAALRWAADNDRDYELPERVLSTEAVAPPPP